ncbi:MAG: hypothetical protein JNJ57_18615, partial [Saprospiraceae bacterium]|nr:hypothetical protein [Saprospiraceae bacterium]
LTVVNTLGQTVRSEVVSENAQIHTMQVRDLPPGNYGLEIKAGAFSDMVRIVITN